MNSWLVWVIMQTAKWMVQTRLSGLRLCLEFLFLHANANIHYWGSLELSLTLPQEWEVLIMVKGLALVFIIFLMFAKTQYLWLAMCCYRMATHVTSAYITRMAFVLYIVRVFGSIWKYRMLWFSWRTCIVRAAGSNVECQRHILLGGPGACPPFPRNL